MPPAKDTELWDVRFFRRHKDDDPTQSCPGFGFLTAIDPRAAQKLRKILRGVAEAPPPSWSGGGTWEAMHDDMAGYYEARTELGEWLYRLFCLLEREEEGLSNPSIIVIDGLKKKKRTRIRPQDYGRVRQLGEEYKKRRPRSVF